MPLNEADTRAQLVNPALARAGWDLTDRTRVRFEVPVHGYDPTPWNGFTDFCLYDTSGYVSAVIEAKRTARDARQGEEQLRQYVTEIARDQPFPPFGFMTNGLLSYFWEVGEAHPRMVAGYFTQDDLQRLHFLRANRVSLAETEIGNRIVDRTYQHEAISRVADRFTEGDRRALVVMATGTGKTRVAMGLIDVMSRANWARRVLFIADRDALVEQALADGFKAHLPAEPRTRIHTANIDQTARMYVATLQTMSRCYEELSPAFFDVIIFDEAHRSIFNRFNEVIEYFDARMVGLTATPASFLARDTYRTFHCSDQLPTFLYPYQQAVDEKRLVDFRLYQAQTGFQRKGIHGADLSEDDRVALFEIGIDPDSVDFSGTDLEKEVSNRDTLRRQWQEIMDVCLKDTSGSLPGKTIVFAWTKAHADRLRNVFEEMFPQYVGLLSVVHDGIERVHDGPYGDGLISRFKKQDLPRIAISVDMLDTGIDIPEVTNLVFMKPVQSAIKMWQMIGRGTRTQEVCRYLDRLPAGGKTEFLIIDFWQNEFGRRAEQRTPAEMPLLVRLFNTRLDLVLATEADADGVVHRQAIADCRGMLSRVPTQSFLVRKVWSEVESAWIDDWWRYLTNPKIEFLRLKVAPLLRFVPNVDVAAETFAHKLERMRLQLVTGSPSPDLIRSIGEDVSLLPGYVTEDPTRRQLSEWVLSGSFSDATPDQLTPVIRELASEMRNRRSPDSAFLHIDLPDFVAVKGFVLVGPLGEPVPVDEYRRRVERRVLEIADQHPAVVALRSGQQPSDEQLVDLERVLHLHLGSDDINLSGATAWRVYGIRLDNRAGFLSFARRVLDLDGLPDYEVIVGHAFDRYISSHRFNSDQIRFLRAVQDVFATSRHLSEADLYEDPFTVFGRNAVDRLFGPAEIKLLVDLASQLAA